MTKVVFLTVFLGLVADRQPVEVLVTGEATRVEFVLDQRVVAVLNAPPWRASIDFGAAPLPHRLEARVFAAGKAPVATATQKVNALAPPQHLEIVVERKTREARVLWSSVDQTRPEKIEARFDGAPLKIARDLTIALPRYDDGRPHLLEVFASAKDEDREAQLVLGAPFESSVAAEMTAVPVRVTSASARLNGITCAAGATPVRVVAIDDLPAEVIVVRTRSANEIATKLEAGPGVRRTPDQVTRVQTFQNMTAAGDSQGPTLTRGDRVRFLWASPRPGQGSVAAMLFDSSRSYSTTTGMTLAFLLSRILGPEDGSTTTRYADAVAVAGLQASQSQRPRAVVLILGEADEDRSRMRPKEAIAYLRSLGVPLYVWSLGDPATTRGWEEVTDISSRPKLDGAIASLRRQLDAQRILWVDGDYLVSELNVKSAVVESLSSEPTAVAGSSHRR